MKKLLWILLLGAFTTACGDGTGRSENPEAATEEDVEIGAGEAISPQLQLDSSETRFEVDTIASDLDPEEQTRGEDF